MPRRVTHLASDLTAVKESRVGFDCLDGWKAVTDTQFKSSEDFFFLPPVDAQAARHSYF